MKKVLILLFIISNSFVAFSQINSPVEWSFSAKKINDKTYEVHLTADINKGWHIYSTTTPDGGPVPTAISFTKNPLLTVDGKIKEIGKLEQKHEPLFGVDVKQFSGRVDFVATIKLKTAVKTNITGSVEFMVCNDKECLPPATEAFSISLK